MATTQGYKCEQCGLMFAARPADRERGWARCCGKACALKLRQRAQRTLNTVKPDYLKPITHPINKAAYAKRDNATDTIAALDAEQRADQPTKPVVVNAQRWATTPCLNYHTRDVQELASAYLALRTAAEQVIEFNHQHAKDAYGDAAKADTWACVVTLRGAL